jgi:hypothetical protein
VTANLAPGGPFDVPNVKIKVGKTLLTRSWKAPYTNGLTDIWRKRCREYWERIEQRFGYVMSEPRNDWVMDDDLGPVVVTYATPIAMLKGERIARPKVPETVQ